MISLFEKELMRMEQEVRDLKTIHQRGLGTVRFYEASVSTTVNGSKTFTANLATGEPSNPLAIGLTYGQAPLENFILPSSSAGLERTVTTINSQNVAVKFISSSAISGVTQS